MFFNVFFLIILAGSNLYAVGQSKDFFIQHGNNIKAVSCGEIIFSPITTSENRSTIGSGSVLVKKPIDLTQSFDLNFRINFTNWIASDGGAFVLTTDSSALTDSLGKAIDGLGFRGMKQSLAVTFDPVQTAQDNDPAFGHVSIQANGDTKHSTANNLAGPISFENLYTIFTSNPPPSQKYFNEIVNVKWNASLKILSVYIGGNLYLTLQNDIVKNIFNGVPTVYWGFTASNTQLQYFPPTSEIQFGYFRFGFGEVFPRYNSTPPLDTCYIKPILFTDSSVYSDTSSVGLQLYKWYWAFGDGTTSVLKNPPPHNYPTQSIYQFKYTVSNQLGCAADTLKKMIALGSTPKVNFTATATCTNTPITITDISKNDLGINVNWLWDLDDNNISIDQNPVVTYTTSGIKKIKLKVRTEFGCEADTTKVIEITDSPAIDFTFLQGCDANIQYTSSLNNSVVIDKWYWEFGDRSFSQLKDPLHKFQQNGTYQSKLFAISLAGCSSSTAKTVNIDKVQAFAGNDTIIIAGESLQLNAKGGVFYQWSPSYGLNNSNVKNPLATLNQDQTYILTAKNSLGCEGKDTINIKVYKGREVYAPSAFTPNNDGLNDKFTIIAPGFLNIDLNIFNRNGQLIFHSTNLSNSWDGTFKGLPQNAAAYPWVIKAIDSRQKLFVKKGVVVLIR